MWHKLVDWEDEVAKFNDVCFFYNGHNFLKKLFEFVEKLVLILSPKEGDSALFSLG